MRIHGCVLLLGLAGCVQAAYTPYVQDSLSSTTGWSVNGSVFNSSAGMTSSSGGSMISATTAPTYPNDYKIQANINLQNGTSGGSYGIMLRASPGSYTAGTTAFGTFYMVELQNVIFSGGVCSSDLRVWKSVSGTATTLSVSSFACSSLVQLAATINGPTIVILINGQFLFAANDSSITRSLSE